MRINLKDVTFLVPVRLDSIVRLENTLISTRYLLKNFDCSILLWEISGYNNGILKRLLDRQIHYSFIEDHDDVFYRTKYLNKMTKTVTTPFLGIWDADVIISKKQILESVERLRTGNFEFVYPYDGTFLDTSDILRSCFLNRRDIRIFQKYKNRMHLIYGKDMKGGAVFVNVKAYKDSGMENENFYGWGSEDFERYERWKNLGYKIGRVDGELFHLTHPRGNNSGYSSVLSKKISDYNLFSSKTMSKSELYGFNKK